MYAGKSEELVRKLRRAEYAHQTVLAFKPAVDNRYSSTDVVSHNNSSFPCIAIENLDDIYDYVDEVDPDVVGFDEAQFFPSDLIDYVEDLAYSSGIRVISAGLDLDFRGQPFRTMIPLVFRAESVTRLNAVCVQCGRDASRTQRIMDGEPVTEGELVSVGGVESYEARCSTCFVPAMYKRHVTL